MLRMFTRPITNSATGINNSRNMSRAFEIGAQVIGASAQIGFFVYLGRKLEKPVSAEENNPRNPGQSPYNHSHN